MKIAGTTFDANEGKEIEDIVKVFIIARRIKNLPYQRKERIKIGKTNLELIKVTNDSNNSHQIPFLHFSVRGLN